MLEMKTECLECKSELEFLSDAMICSFECTYCVGCAEQINRICKNCDDELVSRSKRKK